MLYLQFVASGWPCMSLRNSVHYGSQYACVPLKSMDKQENGF